MWGSRCSGFATACSLRTADETRRSFIEFFRGEGHIHIPSSSVLPAPGDSSLLFTNAGMNQFKGVLSGTDGKTKWAPRVVTHQKCIRAGGRHNDLDDVGRDLHHLSFFEMMGNWSFHDAYDKGEACRLAWKYLTEVVCIPSSRLYVTYFGGHAGWGLPSDQETRQIWKQLGVDDDRILPFTEENFWEMGRTGPCGPSTEIHYDRIENRANASHLVNRDDSVVELWNLVFTNSLRREDGGVESQGELHIDTGLGLERLVSVVQGVASNFDTDLFLPLLSHIHKLGSSRAYNGKVGNEDEGGVDCAYRIVADHLRAATVAISDGAVPAGEDAGFVVRKMIRRGAWRGVGLGLERGALADIVPSVVDSLASAYPELVDAQSAVQATIRKEEESFWRTVERGQKAFNKAVQSLPHGTTTIPGETLFQLHDGQGIGPEVVEMWAAERSLLLDIPGYEERRARAKVQSREADTKKKGVRRG